MASYKKCVEQHCKNCTYDKKRPGTWRAQVEACTATTCALWPVRPRSIETIQLNRNGRKLELSPEHMSIIDNLEDAETV